MKDNFENILKQHFENLTLDIRQQSLGYSRFMDQKVAPDVLSFIADCIVNFIGGKDSYTSFSVNDIWGFQYFIKNSIAVFGKPSPENKKADAEYNKFIAQPLKALAFSKILSEKKDGRKNIYTVLDNKLLEYVSQNERYAWRFLVFYIEKVMRDSGFIKEFEIYKEKSKTNQLTSEHFDKLKKDFQAFMRGYTNINGDTEINRIFPKILNPYATFYQINGTEKGRMTQGRFIYPDLMYNRGNFRDVGKDKNLTRREVALSIKNEPEIIIYRIQKAKNIIKRHHSTSEVKDSLSNDMATQVHHIFPESKFPEISDYLENLILLTAQQHNTRAHPENKTNMIDLDYQKECLLSKIDSITASINKGESLYVRERLIHVINVGYGIDLSTSTNFAELKDVIQKKIIVSV